MWRLISGRRVSVRATRRGWGLVLMVCGAMLVWRAMPAWLWMSLVGLGLLWVGWEMLSRQH